MLSLPFHVLGVWLRGLLALAIVGAGVGLLGAWYNRLPPTTEVVQVPVGRTDQDPNRPDEAAGRNAPQAATPVVIRHEPWRPGWDRETAMLLAGLALVGWSLIGGLVFRSWPRRRKSDDPPAETRAQVQRVRGAGGAELHVEISGPADGPTVVLTHGWGLDSGEWCYARERLARRDRVITWDLPGLGRSGRPADNDWSLEKLAGDLDAVLALAGDRPAVVVGHSIGGMIVLTHCKLFPDAAGRRVAGLVLAQTTYTNPVRTAAQARLYTLLQKPLLEPLCHLMVWLAPLVWVLNWLSYLNGSLHRSTEKGSFSGHESRAQLEALTRKYAKAWPGVIARGMLGMFRYDATPVLPGVGVPALVVVGERDKSCAPRAGEFMVRTIPGARLLRLSKARHCGLYEFHSEFDTAVDEFVSACIRPSGAPETPVTRVGPSRASNPV
jgi:pimeloyl-ACP methyl ester carboxylesterase